MSLLFNFYSANPRRKTKDVWFLEDGRGVWALESGNGFWRVE